MKIFIIAFCVTCLMGCSESLEEQMWNIPMGKAEHIYLEENAPLKKLISLDKGRKHFLIYQIPEKDLLEMKELDYIFISRTDWEYICEKLGLNYD